MAVLLVIARPGSTQQVPRQYLFGLHAHSPGVTSHQPLLSISAIGQRMACSALPTTALSAPLSPTGRSARARGDGGPTC